MKTMLKLSVLLLFCAGAVYAGVRAAEFKVQGPVLTVTATPDHAAIFVDGDFAGCASPERTLSNLQPGKHAVKAIADGYVTGTKIVQLDGEDRTVTLELAPVEKASLSLASTPPGATVIVDGHDRGRTPLTLPDLAPGRHAVEFILTNYIPQLRHVSSASGKNLELTADLQHRQEMAYRARMKNDPGEIAVYNDLAELLFVLGRFDEAADMYVRGYIATGKYEKRDRSNGKNAKKLEAGPLARHLDSKRVFDNLHNLAMLKAIESGEDSPLLLKKAKSIPWAQYKDQYFTAFENLAEKNRDNPELQLELLDICAKARLYDRVGKYAVSFTGYQKANRLQCLKVLRLVEAAAKVAPQDQQPQLLESWRKLLAFSKPKLEKSAYAADYFMMQARLAKATKNRPEELKASRAAIKYQKNARIANSWRLDLANLYHQDRQQEEYVKLLQAISESKVRNDPSVIRADKLLEEIRKAEKPAPEKPAVEKPTPEKEKPTAPKP
jgi:tetratricopeptide (TPR) repeat protein